MNKLITTSIHDYTTVKGVPFKQLDITFQVWGKKLHTAPILLIFHALTGNSDICSPEKGWLRQVVGHGEAIDLDKYTVIAPNILGNGYDGTYIDSYRDFVAKDIAILTHKCLNIHGINKVESVLGASLGGGLAWELATYDPTFCNSVVSIASDWQSSDWLKGVCGVQEQILLHSAKPINDARQMAMLFYRAPESMDSRFGHRLQEPELYEVNSWLQHHGRKLESRFDLRSYLMMNHLLLTIDSSLDPTELTGIKVIQIAISSDHLFTASRNIKTQNLLNKHGIDNYYYEIQSQDGHDAFLIEHEQLSNFLLEHF